MGYRILWHWHGIYLRNCTICFHFRSGDIVLRRYAAPCLFPVVSHNVLHTGRHHSHVAPVMFANLGGGCGLLWRHSSRIARNSLPYAFPVRFLPRDVVNKPFHSRLGTWLQIRALPTHGPTPLVNGDIARSVNETQGVPLADLSNATESRVMSQSVV